MMTHKIMQASEDHRDETMHMHDGLGYLSQADPVLAEEIIGLRALLILLVVAAGGSVTIDHDMLAKAQEITALHFKEQNGIATFSVLQTPMTTAPSGQVS